MKTHVRTISTVVLLAAVLLVSCSQPVELTPEPTPEPEEEIVRPLEDTGHGIDAEFVNGLRMLGKGVYETEDTRVIFPEPEGFGSKQVEAIDRKIARYNQLISEHPDKNFYAFYLELIQFSPYNPASALYPDADNGRSLEHFIANKPDGLILDMLPLTSFEDHIKYYFRTDHHWNARGMLAGYEKIYNMLKLNYPDISPMFKHDDLFTFPDFGFVGTWARKLDYRAEPEPFEVVLLDLPEYRTFDSAGDEIEVSQQEKYLAGEHAAEFFADHYLAYYRQDKIGLLEYVSESGADRNLLIIGDSFSNPLEPLLASHYHHTYAVDIRRLPDYYFSLSEFLSKYDVDDILIQGGANVIMYEWQWTIQP